MKRRPPAQAQISILSDKLLKMGYRKTVSGCFLPNCS